MALKDIAPGIAARLTTEPTPLAGGPQELALAELAALALIPYYCDANVQFCIALGAKTKLDKKRLKVKFTLTGEFDGMTTIAIPGDGIYPPLLLFTQVAAAIGEVVPPGTTFELRTANLGTVKRDYTVKAESVTTAGDQRYVGNVVEGGRVRIGSSAPAVTAEALAAALAVTRLVLTEGPWLCRDRDEAVATVRSILDSRAANINDAFVKQTVRIRGGAINLGAGWERPPTKHYALGLGLFRVRFADGPWNTRAAAASDALGMTSEDQKDAIMAAVVG